ncbi:MAG: Gfo/Idh/MocA family oxidoreductase [Phycisphaerae bacterium]|jgi:predicted dehydrogenase
MPPVTLAIVGAGGRGTVAYASYALQFPDQARVLAVADPIEHRRMELARLHNIPAENIFADWRQLARRKKLTDAVVIATQDAMHTAPAIALAKKGYHMLLEKPMAPTPAECRRIVKTVLDNRIIFAVGHVMRYTPYTRQMKAIIDRGAIGEVVNIQHLEPVGFWHQAHAYVRGKWRNEKESTPMLLAKSCHDMDWIRYMMGRRCVKVASFGSLFHFRSDKAPAGAGTRCLTDCSIESQCPYSARKIYLNQAEKGDLDWPVCALFSLPDTAGKLEQNVEGVRTALLTGPYGRCVYHCDNDVVDNQVVCMEFEGGTTANFTMTAFSPGIGRQTRIFGTRGYLAGDGRNIEHFDFLSNATNVIDTETPDGGIRSGHGGGDYGLMGSFVEAVASNDPSKVSSGPLETLETHLMGFAAEQGRHGNKVVKIAT